MTLLRILVLLSVSLAAAAALAAEPAEPTAPQTGPRLLTTPPIWYKLDPFPEPSL
jgi:hypothetical protein